MYTMLVVDDNPADRRGICSLFDWSGLGIEIIETCSNGERALEVLAEKAVDIVLTDVAMPVMNGISLAERLRRSHPRTRVVFMSCHSDFEYAKSALDMDIHGYVLKPIVADELLAVIRKLLAGLAEEAGRQAERDRMISQLNDMRPMVQEQYLKELLLGNYREIDHIERSMQFLQLPISPRGRMCVISLVLEEFDERTRDLSVEDLYFISYTVKNIIRSQSSTTSDVYPVQFSGKYYSAVVFAKPQVADVAGIDSVDLAVALHSSMLSSLGLSTTVGISNAGADISCAHTLYRQSIEAVNTQFYGGSNPIIPYELIGSEPFAAMDRTADLGALYREIKELVVMGDEAADAALVDRYLQTAKATLPESYVKSITFSIANMIAVVLNEYGYSFSDVCGTDMVVWEKLGAMKSIGNVRRWLLDVFRTIRGHFSDKSRSRGSKLVEKVRQIIREHYREQISVEYIANAAALSESYANSIVKKETGKSIFDHLLEYRLEVAKKLLMNPQSRIGEVSESVGYANKSYFALMFRKEVGVSPSEFRARFTT